MPIVNRKNIFTTGFDQDALIITKPGTNLLNLGDLTTTGDRADGIFADANNVTIRNNAKIETAGDGAAGILVHGNDAHVENFGSITTHGSVFTSKKVQFFSEAIDVEGDRFYIANHGAIRVEGAESSAIIGEGAGGTIINAGTVYSAAAGGIAIFAFSEGAQIINTGQVTVANDRIFAISTGPRDGHEVNQGSIDITGDHTLGMLGLGDRAQIENFGTIETHGTHAIGIEGLGGHLFPEGDNIKIINAGHITTEGNVAIGVALGLPIIPPGTATDASILNTGVIETHGDGAAGVVMIGEGNRLTNSGLITTNGANFEEDSIGLLHAAGVVVSGDGMLVENTAAGVILSQDAASAAVELNVVHRGGLANAGIASHVENFGLIEGAEVAILGGDGLETIINHGHIVGDVILGDGNDTFVFGNGGSLDGGLFLGGGKDLVVIENGAGVAEIADFSAGSSNKDVIDVSIFYSSFEQLASNIHQVANDVVITLDADDQLVLRNTLTGALSASDFLLV